MNTTQLLIGSSQVMERLRANIRCVAGSEHPVLVTGPTGAGKEMVVRAIHELSRGAEPLLDQNCAAIPENLMEAQLFGHKRGAFSGAEEDRDGYFEAAGRGTLFLDEIAELDLALQAKLLRVVETRRFRPVGALDERTFRGRIVAATLRNLEERVRERTFREDLFYRLNVLVVRVPALDEHKEDIPQLVAHFLAAQPKKVELTPSAVELLCHRSWPGNVRQLRTVIDRAVVFAEHPVLRPEDLGPALDGFTPRADASALDELADRVIALPISNKLELVEEALVRRALELAGQNKSAAARLLGVHRKVVERRLEALEPDRPAPHAREAAAGSSAGPGTGEPARRGRGAPSRLALVKA